MSPSSERSETPNLTHCVSEPHKRTCQMASKSVKQFKNKHECDLETQWRSQNLVVVGALKKWGIRRGVASSRKRGLKRGYRSPSPENFRFRVKITCFGAFLAQFE